MARRSVTLDQVKYALIVSAIGLFTLGIIINWFDIHLRIPIFALTERNSGVIELAYILGISYLLLRFAEGRVIDV